MLVDLLRFVRRRSFFVLAMFASRLSGGTSILANDACGAANARMSANSATARAPIDLCFAIFPAIVIQAPVCRS